MPVFLGLNFTGNYTVNADPGIRMGDVWVKGQKQPGQEKLRGASASRWQVDKILAAGYGLVTIYYGDIEPDFNGGRKYGVREVFTQPGDDWGAIGAWAWGLRRAVDVLEKDKAVDAKRIALTGHSRLGKTALWAGARARTPASPSSSRTVPEKAAPISAGANSASG